MIKTLQRQDVGLHDEVQRRLLDVMDGQADRLMRLEGDRARLDQVVSNLLVNSIKHSCGTVFVRVLADAD